MYTYKYAVPDDEMIKNAEGKLALCKVCDRSDWLNAEWQAVRKELHLRNDLHRKPWEFVNGIMGLKRLGVITSDAMALGLGCGCETPMFYLANGVYHVYATDINYEAETPYTYGRFSMLNMDACKNTFGDNAFDFVFAFCAIEHFPREQAQIAMKDIERVLKPGGVAVLSTELNMGNVHRAETFMEDELYEILINSTGMKLIENIDFRVSQSLIDNPLDISQGNVPRNALPHIVLEWDGFIFTSVIFFLRKDT